MLQIKEWLIDATTRLLASGIDSASLDSELILAHILDTDRTYLRAHDDKVLTEEQIELANRIIEKRSRRMPIAYLVGYKYFYGRKFTVNENTLIPRPESEDIIDILKNLPSDTYHLSPIKLLDIGTGSGCLGITAKLEFPDIEVTLSDIISSTLSVAKKNAKNLNADVKFIKSDLLKELKITPNIIIANLPYVDKTWEVSPETKFEPDTALFADNSGMGLIKKMIEQASYVQKPTDVIILESDPSQHQQLIDFASKHGYKLIEKIGYAIAITKI